MFADCRIKKKYAPKIALCVDEILSKTFMTAKDPKVPCRNGKSQTAQERRERARQAR